MPKKFVTLKKMNFFVYLLLFNFRIKYTRITIFGNVLFNFFVSLSKRVENWGEGGHALQNKCTCATPSPPPKKTIPQLNVPPLSLQISTLFESGLLRFDARKENYGFKWRLRWTICIESQTFTLFLSTPVLKPLVVVTGTNVGKVYLL